MSVTFYTTNHFWHHYPILHQVGRRWIGGAVKNRLVKTIISQGDFFDWRANSVADQ